MQGPARKAAAKRKLRFCGSAMQLLVLELAQCRIDLSTEIINAIRVSLQTILVWK